VNPEDLEARETKGEIMPYEKQLIPQFAEIMLEFREALEDSCGFFNQEAAFLGGASSKQGEARHDE